MATFNLTAFLCGYFSYNTQSDPSAVLSAAGWEKSASNEKIIADYRQYYYSEFVDFSFASNPDKGAVKYTLNKEKKIFVDNIASSLLKLDIYLMPYGMALYSIKLSMESDELNEFTLALYKMREFRLWNNPELSGFCNEAIKPIWNVARSLGYTGNSIIENGNKLKIFQIVTADERCDYPENASQTLFELGTLGKVGGCSEGNPDSPSKRYIEDVLEKNRLSYFNNWTGMALFDTFTIMAFSVSRWVKVIWEEDYFSMIYIHSLFCKFYLFRLNTRFRLNPENGEILENEYKEFARRFVFNKISYNFLPGEIDKSIDTALEISEEKCLISNHISEYNRVKADESSHRLNRILTFLTFVTVFSTIWDLASMLNAMWPFQVFSATIESGFRFVVSTITLAVLAIVIFMLRQPKR